MHKENHITVAIATDKLLTFNIGIVGVRKIFSQFDHCFCNITLSHVNQQRRGSVLSSLERNIL